MRFAQENQRFASSMRTCARLVVILAATDCFLCCADADEPVEFFQSEVAPLLESKCLWCHGGAQPKGGLDLTTAESAFRGGESGAAIVPGRPDESTLLEYVTGAQPSMPKNDDPLTGEQVAVLRRWIEGGAHWPAGLTLDRSKAGRDWWSLRAIESPPVPPQPSDWIRTPIDAFVLQKLRDENLSPSPDADRATLVRRLTFDLHGLPPTPDDVTKFVGDESPNAYERLVDRLLASPRYGERWARHWLDVVHYGETHGYDKDKRRPHAWPYRDYVIRSFNEDKPYDRFVREQVAGDVLDPESADGIVATGFIAAGPWDFVGHVELREGTTDKEITRLLDRDDMVTNTMSSFASLTVHCARCHDHKFDPIMQTDYYSLQAVFAGVDRANRPYARDALVFAAASDFKQEGSFAATNGTPRAVHLLDRGSVKSPRAEMSPGAVGCVEALPSRFDGLANSKEGARRAALADWLVDEHNPLTWRSIVNRVWHYHFGRGLVETPNDFGRMGARPTHPELLDWLAANFRDGSRSLKDLHRLIVTSSVYRQSSDEDIQKSALDGGNQYLWRMNRRRLAAEEIRDAVLLASGKLQQKMYGEPFDLFGFIDDHSPHYLYDKHDPDDPRTQRRTVYRFIVRSVPDPFMDTLDCADPSQLVPVRNTTVTALQALSLLNNRFMVRQTEHFAARVKAAAGGDPTAQIEAAFQIAIGRTPRADEERLLTELAHKHGLANACRVIFNLNEFVFVD